MVNKYYILYYTEGHTKSHFFLIYYSFDIMLKIPTLILIATYVYCTEAVLTIICFECDDLSLLSNAIRPPSIQISEVLLLLTPLLTHDEWSAPFFIFYLRYFFSPINIFVL